jgi:hypothetical protein
MDNRESSNGPGGIPEGWVIYRPEEPIYEIRYLCVYLSELADQSVEEAPVEGKKEKE